MADIPAKLVMQLRAETGAPMMDCKRALQETNADFEEAKRWLRERGMAQAAKRADRETTEGLVDYRIDGGKGTIVGVGCETEPVSKNDEFQAFAKKVLDTVDAQGVGSESALDEERQALSGKLGENIVLVDAAQFRAGDGELVTGYAHPPANKIGVLVLLRGGDEDLGRKVARHIAALRPQWVARDAVPEDDVARERDIFANSDEVQSKPEQAREKIVEGMLNKRFFAANVLVDQEWVHDSSKTVAQALKEAGAEVVDFARVSVAN
jgi:elongation factor Ts